MTDTLTPPTVGEIIRGNQPAEPALTPFEGQPVHAVALAIRNTGDGLSAAMDVDPVELHHGDIVDVVLRCEVDKIRYDELRDSDGLKRVQMLKAVRATLIDSDVVNEAFAEQSKRIADKEGQAQLDLEDDGEDDDVTVPEGADDAAALAQDPTA